MKIYVINLDREVERLSWMDGQLTRLGLGYERVPAITPETMPARMTERFHSRATSVTLPNDRACFASHLLAAERLLGSGEPSALVLEDDVEIECDADALAAMAEAATALQLDVLKLSDWPKTPSLEIGRAGGAQIAFSLRTPRGAGAYLLTRRGAERSLGRARDLAMAFDSWQRQEAYLGLDIAQALPPPVPQDRFGPSSLDPERRRGRRLSRSQFHRPPERAAGFRRWAAMARRIGLGSLALLCVNYVRMKVSGVRRDDGRRFVLAGPHRAIAPAGRTPAASAR